ncbi:MAG: tellurite resistance TerB family protein [Fimbriimonadaceae bacterium]|nr:tellurite resistance TerB family protein [Alphaproteobacteria bacterium]
MSETISPQEALIYVMVTISAVDSSMTDLELHMIGDIVQSLPVFKGFDNDQLIPISQSCGSLLSGDNGLNATLDLINASLPARLRETAYALAVEVAAADLSVEQEELRFLQLLRDALNLDKLTIAAIERGARARYTTL